MDMPVWRSDEWECERGEAREVARLESTLNN